MSESRVNGCVLIAGLGFGVVLGGGFLYALFTDEVVRILTLAIGMFVVGGVIVGLAVMYTTRSTAKAVADAMGSQPKRQDLTYNLTPQMEGPRQDPWMIEATRGYEMLPPPPPAMEGRVVGGEDEFVA